jgi:hypothetical protein
MASAVAGDTSDGLIITQFPADSAPVKKIIKKIEVRTCKPYYRFFKQFMLSLKAKGRRQIKALLVPVLASITTPLWI